MNIDIDKRNYDSLSQALQLAKRTVYKDYLSSMHEYPLVRPDDILSGEEIKNCIRMFQLKQLTVKPGEDILQKLSMVYYATMAQGSSLFMILEVPDRTKPVNIYIGTRTPDSFRERQKIVRKVSYNALKEGFIGNFPGSIIKDVSPSNDIPSLFDDLFSEDINHISAVSTVASIRTKDKTKDKDFVQGLERLIEVMNGKIYTAILIAEPVSPSEQNRIREGYESLYSTLSGFKKSIWSYNESESNSVMETLGRSITETIQEGTSSTNSHTESLSLGVGKSNSLGKTNGMNYGKSVNNQISTGKTTPTELGRLNSVSDGISRVGEVFLKQGNSNGAPLMVIGGALNLASAANRGEIISNSIVEGIGKTIGLSVGTNMSITNSWNKNSTESKSLSEGKSFSNSMSTAETESKGSTKALSEGKTLQIECTNKSIEEMLKRIEEQISRLKEEEDYGAYSCGAYFLSDREENCLLAANTYKALMLGEGTSLEKGTITIWDDEDIIHGIKDYLRRMAQPIFAYPMINESYSVCMPGTIVSGKELPLHLGLPTRSVNGLPVVKMATFGRNVYKTHYSNESNEKISLGKLFHMGIKQDNVDVELDLKSLAMHTFITGSTGSGKSNTVYQLLRELTKKKVKFLVVEPAKGEYKHVFGNEIANVYGTNPYISPLLKLNPFKFPKGIHVLEHIDRLIEIFNVCWPMYAAMPAVLKESVERAYISAGWNLEISQNKVSDELFPTFTDVLNELNVVMDESSFSDEVKDNYIGSLATRIKSLTNGIYGKIFATNELGDHILFDENVIVDLSRVGSVETKSMIMGILVMRLQEYRITSESMNADLKHVTVLEEAHNLLKRTSTEQSSETSNLLGKSVEMLSNAIAEVRTYGEGFIIADQAPGLLDMSVIRNTNTKIIMRLPDAEDRNLVGKSASLNEDQINELAKIPTGIAAVYQNNWLEPVLCAVHYKKTDSNYSFNEQNIDIEGQTTRIILEKLLAKVAGETMDMGIDRLINVITNSNFSTVSKTSAIQLFRRNGKVDLDDISSIVYDIVDAKNIEREADNAESIEEWRNSFIFSDKSVIADLIEDNQNLVIECILREQIARHDKPDEYLDIWHKFLKGEVL